MSSQQLRPMGIGDILDTTFRMYRQNFITFLLIALIVYVPYTILMAGIQIVQPTLMSQQSQTIDFDNPHPQVHQVQPVSVLAVAIGMILFGLILIPLCTAALTHNISASYLGRNLAAGESYSRAAPRLLPLIGTQILSGLVIIIGYILLIVPGVIFSLWFAVVSPIVILERTGGTEAMRRSRELMRGNTGKAFILFLVLGILNMIFGGLVGFAANLIPWPHASLKAVVENILPALWLPIQTAPFVLLYYDLRIRKEAFDLEQLSLSLSEATT